jgi:serpin B
MRLAFIGAFVLAFLVMSTASQAERPPGSPPADVKAVVAGNDALAFDLYARLRKQPGNLFFSPNSISTALAMTHAGARGETAGQMAKTLHFTLDRERLDRAFASLLSELNGGKRQRHYQLRVANALWGQQGFDFLPDFLTTTRDEYHAGLENVDFRGDTESARETINRWVAKATQDKIRDLLKPGVLNSTTRLVLTNAVYFKGSWAEPFPKQQTREQPFHTSADRQVRVPMMQQTSHFKYLKARNFQALDLPYADGDLSMVILLPTKKDGLAALEKELTAERLAGWLAKMRSDEVEVSLPRFRMTAEFQLKDTLSALGMSQAFSAGEADFSGMDGKRDLYLSAVVHQAYVDVNEEGTEAAAATGAIVAEAKAVLNPPVFRADHPFVFLIRDNRTGSVLFLGRLVDPQK